MVKSGWILRTNLSLVNWFLNTGEWPLDLLLGNTAHWFMTESGSGKRVSTSSMVSPGLYKGGCKPPALSDGFPIEGALEEAVSMDIIVDGGDQKEIEWTNVSKTKEPSICFIKELLCLAIPLTESQAA